MPAPNKRRRVINLEEQTSYSPTEGDIYKEGNTFYADPDGTGGQDLLSGGGGGGSGIEQELLDGNLVVSSDSLSSPSTVDPTSFASPLTEALNRVTAGEAALVRLPYAEFTDTGVSLDLVNAMSGRVTGATTAKATHWSSKITFTGTDPGIRGDGFNADMFTFERFYANGNGDDHPFIEFDSVNSSTNPRGTNFKDIWVQDFSPSGGEGLIDYKGAHAFSNVFENIFTGAHTGPMFRFSGDDPFMTRIINCYADGNNSGTRNPVIQTTDRSAVMEIHNLNIGGGYDQILNGSHFGPGDIRLMSCNYEPRSLTNGGDLIDLTGGGSLTTGTLHVTGASGLADVSSAIKCNSSVGKRVIGPIKNIGFDDIDYTNGKLWVTGDPGNAIEFSGETSEVNNTSGAGNIVNCKLDPGKANA